MYCQSLQGSRVWKYIENADCVTADCIPDCHVRRLDTTLMCLLQSEKMKLQATAAAETLATVKHKKAAKPTKAAASNAPAAEEGDKDAAEPEAAASAQATQSDTDMAVGDETGIHLTHLCRMTLVIPFFGGVTLAVLQAPVMFAAVPCRSPCHDAPATNSRHRNTPCRIRKLLALNAPL